VLWAWMQERDRLPGAYDHACCISAPRCLWLAPVPAGPADGSGDGCGGPSPRVRLWQEPLPELSELRRRSAKGRWAWRPDSTAGPMPAAAAGAAGAAPLRLAPGLRTAHLDLEVELERASAGGGGGFAVVLQPAAPGAQGAAVVFSWETQELQVGGARGKGKLLFSSCMWAAVL
jgi:hypothetical protein